MYIILQICVGNKYIVLREKCMCFNVDQAVGQFWKQLDSIIAVNCNHVEKQVHCSLLNIITLRRVLLLLLRMKIVILI